MSAADSWRAAACHAPFPPEGPPCIPSVSPGIKASWTSPQLMARSLHLLGPVVLFSSLFRYLCLGSISDTFLAWHQNCSPGRLSHPDTLIVTSPPPVVSGGTFLFIQSLRTILCQVPWNWDECHLVYGVLLLFTHPQFLMLFLSLTFCIYGVWSKWLWKMIHVGQLPSFLCWLYGFGTVLKNNSNMTTSVYTIKLKQ